MPLTLRKICFILFGRSWEGQMFRVVDGMSTAERKRLTDEGALFSIWGGQTIGGYTRKMAIPVGDRVAHHKSGFWRLHANGRAIRLPDSLIVLSGEL